jgi:hypothetical protein
MLNNKKILQNNKIYSEFEKRTDESLKRYEQGRFKEMSAKEFLKTLEKW